MSIKLPLIVAAVCLPAALFAGQTQILAGSASNGSTSGSTLTSGDFAGGAINTNAEGALAVTTDGGGQVLVGGTTQVTVNTAGNSVNVSGGYVSAHAPADSSLTVTVGELTITLKPGASISLNFQAETGQISLAVLAGSVDVGGPGGTSTVGNPGVLASNNRGATIQSWSPVTHDSLANLSATTRVPLQFNLGEASRLALLQNQAAGAFATDLSNYITTLYSASLAEFRKNQHVVDFYFKETATVFHEQPDHLRNRLNDPTLVISGN